MADMIGDNLTNYLEEGWIMLDNRSGIIDSRWLSDACVFIRRMFNLKEEECLTFIASICLLLVFLSLLCHAACLT